MHSGMKSNRPKLNPVRTSTSEVSSKKRIGTFEEVALGYLEEEALKEAERCLECATEPCRGGCPVSVPIKEFIIKIKEKDYRGAIKKIKETNNLPAICGRVCPQEDQCEKVCVVAKKGESVAIGALERFAADWEIKNAKPDTIDSPSMAGRRFYGNDKEDSRNRFKVAVIGAGPAGLTAAGDLAKMGYEVTLFEGLHCAGGVLSYGIPRFRLPQHIVDIEVDYVKRLGVEIKLNTVIGKTYDVEDLLHMGYRAVFIGTGAGSPRFMNVPGENLNGVYSANEFLTRNNLMKAYAFPEFDTPIKRFKKVVVVGGGNTALDAARTALRLGAEVSLVYRRGAEEMPGRAIEIHHAKEEGVSFEFLTLPVEIIGDDGWVKSIKCVRMELGEPDESGRRSPKPVAGSEFEMPADEVIVAIGTSANPLIQSTTKGLRLHGRGYIEADSETGQTSIPGVFAGGDIVTGAATVITAMGAGKRAAKAIDEYMKSIN